jgi:hypothetical protein
MLTFKLAGINDAGKSTTFCASSVPAKEFKTGSDGYFASTKTAVPKTAVTLMIELSDDDTKLAVMTVPAKDFKTGSCGYFTSEKVAMEGGLYQMQVQLVLVGSKVQARDVCGNVYQTQVQLVRIGSKPVVIAPTTLAEETTLAFAGK